MKEEWRDIEGYEGRYQVSNLGRVKSLTRINPQNHLLKERIRKAASDKNDYQIVNLCKDGIVKLYKVHRLVGEAFLDNPDGLPQINHKDGNKRNNDVSNLEWASASQNVQHAFDTGLKYSRSISSYGEKNPHCKVTDAQCDEIRHMKENGNYTNRRLAEIFGIGTSQISRILRGEQRMRGSVTIG